MGMTIVPRGKEDHEFYMVPQPDPQTGETTYVGKLEPNFFCRGWNPKRKKYCMGRAGQGTDHSGEGRCKNHGGSNQITHGRYSNIARGSLAEHVEQMELETEAEQLDLMPEIRMLRAITAKYIENYDEILDAFLAWNDREYEEAREQERKPKPVPPPKIEETSKLLGEIGALVDRVHKQRSSNAISFPDFLRLMAAMSDVVANRVRDMEQKLKLNSHQCEALEEMLQKISEDWQQIKLTKVKKK